MPIKSSLSEEEKIVFNAIRELEPKRLAYFKTIIEKSELPTAQTLSALFELEKSGYVMSNWITIITNDELHGVRRLDVKEYRTKN